MLVHLHTHSDFSFLDGMQSPASLVERAAELGCPGVGLSDHGEVSGHIELRNAAKSAGIKPIYGYECYQYDPERSESKRGMPHLTLWAMNEEGLRNLWSLSTKAFFNTQEGHKRPHVLWEDLEKFSSGLIAGSACLGGYIPRMALASRAAKNALPYLEKVGFPVGDIPDYEAEAAGILSRYRFIFENRFFFELHTNREQDQEHANEWLYKFSKANEVGVIYASDAHYSRPEDAEIHDVLLGVQTRKKFNESHMRMGQGYHLLDEDEVRSRLSSLGDEAVEAAFAGVEQVFNLVDDDIKVDDGLKIPVVGLPDSFKGDNHSFLRELSSRGMMEKVGGFDIVGYEDGVAQYSEEPSRNTGISNPEAYLQQAQFELDFIIRNDLTDYFLTVADYTAEAKKTMLVGPGRGSAAGSIVSWFIGITEVDPIKYGLLFERFLNEGRVGSLPDVDLDFPDSLRHGVEEYLREKYGEDHVAAIGTITRFGLKQALKDAAFYFNMDFRTSQEMTNLIDTIPELINQQKPGFSWDSLVSTMPPEALEKFSRFEREWPRVFLAARKLFKLARQSSKHAAGVIISPVSLDGILPLRKKDDQITTQFDMHAVEKLGFLKVDVLGLRTLTTLTEAINLIEKKTGERIDFYKFSNEDYDDEKVWELLSHGHTWGVFQAETPGLTGTLRKMNARSVDDLSAAIAMYRPGVLGMRLPNGKNNLEEYLSRRSGESPVTYLHPDLEQVLSETLGIIVYQEQTIEICKRIAGYTPVEADDMRSAIGKKKEDKMRAHEEKFIPQCVERGYDRTLAVALYQNIKEFAGYGFNKCVSGGTVVVRSSGNQYSPAEVTVADLCATWQLNSSAGKKYRDPNRGLHILSLDVDGRIRPRRVLGVFEKGEQDVWRVSTESGRSLVCTANHRSMTSRGWLRLDEMLAGDSLMVDYGYESTSEHQNFSGRPQVNKRQSVLGKKGFQSGKENPGFIDGSFVMFEEWSKGTPDICANDPSHEGRIERHHRDGDKSNNRPENLVKLCVSCHKKADYAIGRTRRWGKGHASGWDSIVSIEYVGKEMTYDIEMEDPHNFVANGIVTHNSHSVSYGIIAYWCVGAKTRIFDWDKGEYVTIAGAYRNGIKTVACYDEDTGKTIGGRVKKVIKSGKKPSLVLMTEDRKQLTCSDEHLILTDTGYVKASDINVGDLIAVERRRNNHPPEVGEKISRAIKSQWDSGKRSRSACFGGIRGRTSESVKSDWAKMSPEEREARLRPFIDAGARSERGWMKSKPCVADDGHKVFSRNELAVDDWLSSHGLEHDVQVHLGNGRFADFMCQGVYIEMDGMGRDESYFDGRFGDSPFVVLKSVDEIEEKLSFLLETSPMMDGDEVVFRRVISKHVGEDVVMYDLVMEDDPHNFLANGMVVHNCAYLKVNYPVEFMTALLNTDLKNTDKHLLECKRMGIPVLPPHVNRSKEYFSIDGDSIVFGLMGIMSVGGASVGAIVEGAPYEGFDDFLARIPARAANKTVVINLIKVNAFDGLSEHHSSELLSRFEHGVKTKDGARSLKPVPEDWEEAAPYSTLEIEKMETELLGHSLTHNPFAQTIERMGTSADGLDTMESIESGLFTLSYSLLIRVVKITKVTSKNGNAMARIGFQTHSSEEGEFVVFPDKWGNVRDFFRVGKIVLVLVDKDEYKGNTSLVLKSVRLVS